MEKDLAAQVEKFNAEVKLQGEEVVFRTFPTKRLILESDSNFASPFHTSNSPTTDVTVYPPPSTYTEIDLPSKKRKISPDATNGSENYPTNPQNDTQHARLPNLVLENKHVKHLHSIVKKECEELATAIDKVKLWVTLAIPNVYSGDNFEQKICSKLIKYPFVEDYTSALQEHDDKQIYSARHHLQDIRNLYAALTDITQKNVTKIRTPRSNNSSGLY
ncbi:proteasome activator pa28, REG alpha/beta subunit [Gymnopus androsaceus JB14]|uniref:Proteasome activator pa28, REG alpha/beta subunit n=1 Tax=Gymnopus androsaceus JB14 TaxID=1447944 RepID=A0A6A4HS15_9AGAR|nr:proteasome activator pa28, REG alpha/beta subunit [Gymnopus androsaceus JB14]